MVKMKASWEFHRSFAPPPQQWFPFLGPILSISIIIFWNWQEWKIYLIRVWRDQVFFVRLSWGLISRISRDEKREEFRRPVLLTKRKTRKWLQLFYRCFVIQDVTKKNIVFYHLDKRSHKWKRWGLCPLASNIWKGKMSWKISFYWWEWQDIDDGKIPTYKLWPSDDDVEDETEACWPLESARLPLLSLFNQSSPPGSVHLNNSMIFQT